MLVIVRRGPFQVDGQCRRYLLLLLLLPVRVRWHVVRRNMLLEAGSRTNSAGHVVRFVLRCEVH